MGKKEKLRDKEESVLGVDVAVLQWVLRVGLFEVIFEQKLDEGEAIGHLESEHRKF